MTKRSILASSGLAVAALWALIRSGTGVLPGIEGPLDAALIWPQRPTDAYAAFLADSPFGILVFRGLGLQTAVQLRWLHVVAIVVAVALLAAWAFVTARSDGRWLAARLNILAPATAVMLVWIGSYDPWTAIAWAVALFAWRSGRRWVVVLGGIPLGFQHFEHALLGLLVLWLVWLALRPQVPKRLHSNPLWLLAGLALGKAALLVVFAVNGVAMTGRTQWLGPFLHEWTATAVNIAPMMLWSLFAGWWAVVAYLVLTADARRARWLFVAAFAIGLVATALSGDRPRVFVMVALPAVALMAVVFASTVDLASRERKVIETVVWVAPPVFLWGKVVVSANVVDLIVIAWGALTS